VVDKTLSGNRHGSVVAFQYPLLLCLARLTFLHCYFVPVQN
jgi:hypothetical protein